MISTTWNRWPQTTPLHTGYSGTRSESLLAARSIIRVPTHTLFMHDDSPLRHRAGEAIVPSRHDGFVAPQRYSVVRGRRQVVGDPEAPGLRPEFTHHEIANDQTSPIEIPVIAQSGAGGSELGEQGLLGG